MTVLAGIRLGADDFIAPPNTASVNLNAFPMPAYPPAISEITVWRSGAGALATHYPVGANGTARDGFALQSYVEDFYDRIHVTPALLDLGNLVTTQVRQVSVWNAWRSRSVQLQQLTAQGADGIAITGQDAPPLAFTPLQERVWTVSVSTSGPPNIDATLSWIFAGDPKVSMSIRGSRLIAWLTPPNWTDSITETLTWSTDVQQSYNGNQVRQIVRAAPQRQWEFGILAVGIERTVLEAQLFEWSGRVWALPVWAEISLLTSALPAGTLSVPVATAGLDFVVGGLAMLWTDVRHYELVEIQDVAVNALQLQHGTVQAWPRGARIYPCRTARLTETASLARATDTLVSSRVRFEAVEPCDWPAIAPATIYLGFPVLEARGNEPSDPTATYARQLATLDSDVGFSYVTDPTNKAWPTQTYNWLLNGRAERSTHRSLLYYLQGRAAAIWIPTWTTDLTLLVNVIATSVVMIVDWTGVSQFLAGKPGRRHIRLEMIDGRVFYRRVSNAIDLGDGTEQLSIDSAFGAPIDPAKVRQISWMMLATLASDSVAIEHITDSEGLASCGVTFSGVPAEEP